MKHLHCIKTYYHHHCHFWSVLLGEECCFESSRQPSDREILGHIICFR